MRVGVFSPDYLMPKEEAGSYIHLLQRQLSGLANLNHKIFVFADGETTQFNKKNKINIISIKNIFSKKKSFFTYHFSGMPMPSTFNQVKSLITKSNLDLIYGCGSPFFGTIISMLGKKTKTPTIYYIYEPLVEKKWDVDVIQNKTPLGYQLRDFLIMSMRDIPRNRINIRRGLSNIDKLVASSKFTLNSLKNVVAERDNIPIIYPSITIPERYKTNFEGKRVTYFGHMRPGRGIVSLLKSFNELVKNRQDAELFIACSEIHEPTLSFTKYYIKKYNLEKKVKIVGKVKNVISDILLKSDAILLPHEDGHSIKFLESLSAGIPLVVTRVGWAEEIIQNNVNGILVESKNHLEMTDAIERLFSDSSFSKKISKNARKTAFEKFDINNNSKKLEKIMQVG